MGFAYSPEEHWARTVFRGGYGIFYGFPEGLALSADRRDAACGSVSELPGARACLGQYLCRLPRRRPVPTPARRPRRTSRITSFALPVSGGVLDPQSKVNYTAELEPYFRAPVAERNSFFVGVRRQPWIAHHGLAPVQPGGIRSGGNLSAIENARQTLSRPRSGGAAPNLTNTRTITRCRPA